MQKYNDTNDFLNDGKNKVIKKEQNMFNFKYDELSDEEMIKGAIESDIPVLLHGKSSDGKSSRIKEIDPNCIIIYLRNATIDSINGIRIVNELNQLAYDLKPTWLIKLEDICKREPDKKHILFFDEINNAQPTIQSMVFNIFLERKVNDKWTLPDNACLVASANEMNESLTANEIPQLLYNRFAHIYVDTSVEKWLTWAAKNRIHPAIYTYIAYKRESALRTDYTGSRPNADPRKWEMASKVLYTTNNPEMLRTLIGEDLTKDFTAFCQTNIIPLEDVLNDNYNSKDVSYLNSSSKYAEALALTQVDEPNFAKARDFAKLLGQEYTAIFDAIWAQNDYHRLELIEKYKEGNKVLKINGINYKDKIGKEE